MDLPSAIQQVIEQRNLTATQMSNVMQLIMQGKATDAQIAAFLVGLRMKGETVTELVSAAKVMRSLASPLSIDNHLLVDLVGTGGDNSQTFNISTTSAFVVAAAGAKVAKHGNRAITSASGSADVLAAAGANLELNPSQVADCITQIGIGFLFAPYHHMAMKHVLNARRELKVRTLFNLLGPLTNPAPVQYHLIGVYHKKWLQPFAEALGQLGSKRALVIHAIDGMDEISLSSPTEVVELDNHSTCSYTLHPSDFGFKPSPREALQVSSISESLKIMNDVLDNVSSPARDIVALNAGAALYVANIAPTLAKGVKLSLETLATGAAKEKLLSFIELSQQMKND